MGWAQNPIPRAWKVQDGNWGKGSNHLQTGYGFDPYCVDEGEDPTGSQFSCTGMWGPTTWRLSTRCSFQRRFQRASTCWASATTARSLTRFGAPALMSRSWLLAKQREPGA